MLIDPTKRINPIRKITARGIFFESCKSIGILLICTVIGLLFHFHGLSEANIITIYILGILIISSITADWLYGIISSFSGVLLFNCLFAEPRFTLFFYDWQYSITTLIMFVASLVTSYLMARFREQLKMEILQTKRSEILLETSQSLQKVSDQQDIFQIAISHLSSLHGQPALLYPVQNGRLMPPITASSEEAAPFTLSEQENDKLANWMKGQSHEGKLLESTLAGKDILYFKIQSHNHLFGIAGVFKTQGEKTTHFILNLSHAMLDEVALSMEKNRLQIFNETIHREKEEERLRANLLRTISHDLRTPLTGIMGNADILLKSGDKIEARLRNELYQDIYDDSQWLIHVVENLLFVTRLENGGMILQTSPELLQDILPEVLRHLNRRGKNQIISIEMPEELLMARMDAQLIMHVLLNILDNAVKYTPPGSRIVVRAVKRGKEVLIEVADNGKGIPNEEKGKVFEMFYTGNNAQGDGRREIGLGLALCKSIVKAHGGAVYVKDNQPIGSIFGFSLQLEEVGLGES